MLGRSNKFEVRRQKFLLRVVLLGISLSAQFVFSQSTIELENRYANTINRDDLKKHLNVLASDEYEGRETGEKGQKMAAAYIAEQFKKMGLKPGVNDTGYFQHFPLEVDYKKEVFLTVNNKEYKANADYLSFYGLSEKTIHVNEIMFAGYGTDHADYSDYKKTKVSEQVLMVLDGEPMSKDSVYFISGTKKHSEWAGNYKMKEEIAREKGARALLIVVNNIDTAYKMYRHKILATSIKLMSLIKKEKIPVIFISEQLANNIAGKEGAVAKWKEEISKQHKTVTQKVNADAVIDIKVKEKLMSSENVLGYLEGSDLKNELVVVTAHYDHLGIVAGQVFNGADDDGSGTVSVIELAEAFATAKKEGHGPRRSMLFMTFSGEEKGLLGSEYYTDNPVYPLKNTVADLNIDMVGRVDEKHKDSIDYVYIIGSDKLSSDLHRINETANAEFCKLKLDYTYNSTSDPNRYYYRSDHYNFAKNNIPVIFYFNGTHADYHKETDEVSKINFELIEKRARLVFYTAWELANRNDRIKVDIK